MAVMETPLCSDLFPACLLCPGLYSPLAGRGKVLLSGCDAPRCTVICTEEFWLVVGRMPARGSGASSEERLERGWERVLKSLEPSGAVTPGGSPGPGRLELMVRELSPHSDREVAELTKFSPRLEPPPSPLLLVSTFMKTLVRSIPWARGEVRLVLSQADLDSGPVRYSCLTETRGDWRGPVTMGGRR